MALQRILILQGGPPGKIPSSAIVSWASIDKESWGVRSLLHLILILNRWTRRLKKNKEKKRKKYKRERT